MKTFFYKLLLLIAAVVVTTFLTRLVEPIFGHEDAIRFGSSLFGAAAFYLIFVDKSIREE